MTREELNFLITQHYKERKTIILSDYNDRLSLALQNPEFKILFEKRKELVIKSSKLKEQGLDSAKIENEIKDLSKQLLNVIKKYKFDLSYHYRCKDCLDTGFIQGKECHCRKKLKEGLYRKISNLPSSATATFESNNFDKLKVSQAGAMNKIYKLSKDWVKNFKETPTITYLINGDVGIGKTTLVYSICNALISDGYNIYYTTTFDLGNIFVEKYYGKLEDLSTYNNLFECDLLAIDNFGLDKNNKILIESLTALIENRINNNKKVLISTNLIVDSKQKIDQIKELYGERFSSLINNSKYSFVPDHIIGQDLRKL